MNQPMTRKRRTRILIEGNPQLRHALAQEIGSKYRVDFTEEPRQSLVMLKVRDGGQRGLFYAGEYLVSEARALINGVIGIGILGGEDDDGARDLAIVDAAIKASLPETEAWFPRLIAEEASMEEKAAAEERRIADTRVSFESMQVERPIWAST